MSPRSGRAVQQGRGEGEGPLPEQRVTDRPPLEAAGPAPPAHPRTTEGRGNELTRQSSSKLAQAEPREQADGSPAQGAIC